MRKILLTMLAAGCAASGMYAVATKIGESGMLQINRASKTEVSVTKAVSPAAATKIDKLNANASVSVFQNANGDRFKKLNVVSANKTINPKRAASRAKAPAECSFFESFEDESLEACGWTTESKLEVSDENFSGWGVSDNSLLSMLGIKAPDGDRIAYINFCSDQVEEWLISPKFTVKANDQLGFYMYINAAFFNSTSNIDWDTMEYIGEPERLGDVEVMIRKGDGEWARLASIMDQLKGFSFMDLLSNTDYNWSFSLEGYEGDDVQIAFKYTGADVDYVGIDAVTVAPPSMEGVAFMEPFEMLYWGTDRSADWLGLTLTLAMAPVQTPLKWINNSDYVEGATYSWTYHDPITNDLAVSTEQDLEMTYYPDFTSDFTRRNNMYYAPVLTGSAPGASDGSSSRGYTYFQTGGKPEFELNDGTIMEMGLMPYPQNVDGNTVTIIDDETVGDMALPIFGHNVNVDKFWLNWTMNGDEAGEDDYVRLNGYCNFVYAPGKPLVVNGAHTLAVGKISDEAKFRCDIYALTENMEIDDENIIATAECNAADVQVKEGAANDLLNIPFDFDKPVILDNSQAPAYVVKISGFNSDAVSYFAPIQSSLPDPNCMCMGWVEKKILIHELSDKERQSFMPIADVEGENGPLYNAFAINLDGYYPFMACETTEVELGDEPVEVNLGSYYDGSELTIETPAGVEAACAGRYDSCVLTLTATATTEGNVKISAPGIEHNIHVNATSGIRDMGADKTAVKEIYTLDGCKVSGKSVMPGVYMVRRADGSVAKEYIR